MSCYPKYATPLDVLKAHKVFRYEFRYYIVFMVFFGDAVFLIKYMKLYIHHVTHGTSRLNLMYFNVYGSTTYIII